MKFEQWYAKSETPINDILESDSSAHQKESEAKIETIVKRTASSKILEHYCLDNKRNLKQQQFKPFRHQSKETC